MFFSSITHELRTPLNTIIPMSQNLAQYISDSKGQIYLKIIINAALHLQNMIEDTLDLSRIENHKFELNFDYFDVRSIIRDVADIMRFQIEQKKLNLYTIISPSVPLTIFSDAKRFKQVLFNLLGNAAKFTLKGYIKVNVYLEN